MIDIELNLEASANEGSIAQEPVSGRSVFAIGWIRYKPGSPGKSAASGEGDELRVLGVVVVRDGVGVLKEG